MAITQKPRPSTQNVNVRPIPHCPPCRRTFLTLNRYQAPSATMITSIGTSTVHAVNAWVIVNFGGPL